MLLKKYLDSKIFLFITIDKVYQPNSSEGCGYINLVSLSTNSEPLLHQSVCLIVSHMGTALNSLAFDIGSENKKKNRECDWPCCEGIGEFKAPKNRNDLRSYLWLCLDHIRIYNKQWNYYAGMSEQEIEEDRKRDTLWDRTTWPISGKDRNYNSTLTSPEFTQTCYNYYNGDLSSFEINSDASMSEGDAFHLQEPSALSALSILGLKNPVTANEAKNSYKILVKRYHPDTNTEDPTAEEKFKELTKAYETLKTFFTS